MKTRTRRVVAVTAGLILSAFAIEAGAVTITLTGAEQGAGAKAAGWRPDGANFTVDANWGGVNGGGVLNPSGAAGTIIQGSTGLGVSVNGYDNGIGGDKISGYKNGSSWWQELVFTFDDPVSVDALTVGLNFITFTTIGNQVLTGVQDDPVFYYGIGGMEYEISEALLEGAFVQTGTLETTATRIKMVGYIPFSSLGLSGDVDYLKTRSTKGNFQVNFISTSVPDGGMTAMMLGLALLGLGGIARRTRG